MKFRLFLHLLTTGPTRRWLAGSVAAVCLLMVAVSLSSAASVIQLPEFTETNHQIPDTNTPDPQAGMGWDILDVALLVIALSAAAYFALRQRSRAGLWCIMVGSLIYFGFVRAGCICPVGSVQNLAYALSHPDYALPWIVIALFALPLIFALLFGRVFCASVCPLGAIQDLFAFKPIRLPRWLVVPLEMIPWVILVMAVILAVHDCMFLICRHDPFVGLFRLGGPARRMMAGAVFLLLGVFVARPYCRFVCPYGVLLRLASWVSWKHLSITPDKCVQCRLCESACPFDAIEPTAKPITPRRTGKTRLAVTIALLPLWIALAATAGYFSGPAVAQLNPTVAMYERLIDEEDPRIDVQGTTLETEAFRKQGHMEQYKLPDGSADLNKLRADQNALASPIALWVTLGGGLIGLIFGLRLIAIHTRRTHDDYIAHRGRCVSCGRCFKACPVPAASLPTEPTQGGDA